VRGLPSVGVLRVTGTPAIDRSHRYGQRSGCAESCRAMVCATR
jgi:hypothetical protein